MEVIEIGRLQWYVASESRPDMVHLVDFEPTEYTRYRKVWEGGKIAWEEGEQVVEPTFCSCEAFNMLHHRPCKHQRRVIMHLVNSIPLTGEQRERMTYQLEQLCRQSPHWTNPHPEDEQPPEPKPPSSIKSKREYRIYEHPHAKR